MNKKAQSALEFITTYGWAFLIILIMIGTLAYFGILNPGKFLPNRCLFGAEFQCMDYQVSAPANSFRLKLKNSIGEAISVDTITLSSEGTTTYTCSTQTNASLNPWKNANVTDIVWTGCNSAAAGFSAGDKAKVFVTVRYYDVTSGPSYMKETKGEVLSTVI